MIEARQESQILTAYAMSPFLRAYDFKVTVCRGNVTLSGSVADEVSSELARQIALSVGGIKSVDCKIDVVANYSAPARSDRGFGEIVDDLSLALLSGTAENTEAKEVAGRANSDGQGP